MEEQSLAVNCGSRRESEEIPTELLSTPHALTHWSVSIYSDILSTITSDVLHWYSISPFSLAYFSNKHRFPEDAIEKAHLSLGNSSHIISPKAQINNLINQPIRGTKRKTNLRKISWIYIPKAACSKREETKKRMNEEGEEEEEKAIGLELFSRWLLVERKVGLF